MLVFGMKNYSFILLFTSLVIGISLLPSVYGQDNISKTITKKKC